MSARRELTFALFAAAVFLAYPARADLTQLTGATAVSANGDHGCALTTAGGVKCWGANSVGQLGNGTTMSSLIAQDVLGLNAGVTSVATGAAHTCALITGGGAKCWGYNSDGQLGNGSTTNSLTPVDVLGVTGVVAIAPGYDHTCLLTAGGGVKCWGNNAYGQLGNGTTTSTLTPVDVTGLSSGVVAIAAAGSSSFYYGSHTCALTSSGGVKCWGWNSAGQLGTGTTASTTTPVDVAGLTSGVVALSADFNYTCAVTTSGTVKCWGANESGQLGNGTTDWALAPVGVVGVTTATAVTVGRMHTCALMTTGGAKCWGANGSGELGDGSTTPALTAVDVTTVTESVRAIAAGAMHTCALTASGGAVKCWGNNELGQVGNGVPASFKTPVDTVGLNAGVASIAAGNQYSCGVSASGGAKCWGANDRGQLGTGTTTHALTPADVTAISGGTVAIAASKGWLGGHTCALTSGGGVKCWGDNVYGQLGNGTTVTSLSPVDVTGLTAGVASVATGEYHACALKMGGDVLCWGRGYLGNGTTSGSLTPVTVIGLPQSVLAIAAGAAHTCALTAGGGVKCWGFNGHGQIGNGTISDAVSAVDATGMTTGVAAITAAYDHSCALTTVGGIKCWGNNVWGQLGTGDTTDHRIAVDVAGMASGAVAVSAGGSVEWVGGSHTCALVVGGGVKCWGVNEFGQLGNGNTANAYAPVDVTGLIAGATTVSAGTNHTCAVTAGGAVKCWGSNRRGQLGNGIAGYFTTAQNVLTVAQNGIPIAATEVPALSVWGLWLLSLVLGGAAMRTIAPRRH